MASTGQASHARSNRSRSTTSGATNTAMVSASSLKPSGASFAQSANPTHWSRSRSEERRVGKSVDLGGRRIIKKKKIKKDACIHSIKDRDREQRVCSALY